MTFTQILYALWTSLQTSLISLWIGVSDPIFLAPSETPQTWQLLKQWKHWWNMMTQTPQTRQLGSPSPSRRRHLWFPMSTSLVSNFWPVSSFGSRICRATHITSRICSNKYSLGPAKVSRSPWPREVKISGSALRSAWRMVCGHNTTLALICFALLFMRACWVPKYHQWNCVLSRGETLWWVYILDRCLKQSALMCFGYAIWAAPWLRLLCLYHHLLWQVLPGSSCSLHVVLEFGLYNVVWSCSCYFLHCLHLYPDKLRYRVSTWSKVFGPCAPGSNWNNQARATAKARNMKKCCSPQVDCWSYGILCCLEWSKKTMQRPNSTLWLKSIPNSNFFRLSVVFCKIILLKRSQGEKRLFAQRSTKDWQSRWIDLSSMPLLHAPHLKSKASWASQQEQERSIMDPWWSQIFPDSPRALNKPASFQQPIPELNCEPSAPHGCPSDQVCRNTILSAESTETGSRWIKRYQDLLLKVQEFQALRLK